MQNFSICNDDVDISVHCSAVCSLYEGQVDQRICAKNDFPNNDFPNNPLRLGRSRKLELELELTRAGRGTVRACRVMCTKLGASKFEGALM